jgi:hypothetical protein
MTLVDNALYNSYSLADNGYKGLTLHRKSIKANKLTI